MSAERTIDRYVVIDTPYKSHDFVLYEATHPETGKPVFLKTGNPDTRDRKGVSSSLTQEAALLRRCQHPFVPRWHETVWHDHFPVIVMEKVEGRTLGEICGEGALDSAEWLKTFMALADALAWIHAQDVLHLDLHLENIIVGDDGIPRILDFGAATEVGYDRTLNRLNPRTTAPELLTGTGTVDGRCDVYSLGVIAMIAALGEERFRELLPHVYSASDMAQRNRWMTLFRDSADPFPKLARECRGVVALLGPVVNAMVNYDPDTRLQNVDEVRSAIQEALACAGAGEERSKINLGDMQMQGNKHRVGPASSARYGQKNKKSGSKNNTKSTIAAVFVLTMVLGLGTAVFFKFRAAQAAPAEVSACHLDESQLKTMKSNFVETPIDEVSKIRGVVQKAADNGCLKFGYAALKNYGKRIQAAPVDSLTPERRKQLLGWVRESMDSIEG